MPRELQSTVKRPLEVPVTLDAVLKALHERLEGLDEVLAVLVFGSLARGKDFGPRSDIDVCVVLPEDDPRKPIEADNVWYGRVKEALSPFWRDVTVLTYTPLGLRKVSSWYVLRLAVEGKFAVDRGDIAGLFVKIIDAAHRAGLEQRLYGDTLLWAVKRELIGQHIKVEVEE